MVAPRSVSVTVRPLSERVWELHASETITGTIDKSLIAAQRDAPSYDARLKWSQMQFYNRRRAPPASALVRLLAKETHRALRVTAGCTQYVNSFSKHTPSRSATRPAR